MQICLGYETPPYPQRSAEPSRQHCGAVLGQPQKTAHHPTSDQLTTCDVGDKGADLIGRGYPKLGPTKSPGASPYSHRDVEAMSRCEEACQPFGRQASNCLPDGLCRMMRDHRIFVKTLVNLQARILGILWSRVVISLHFERSHLFWGWRVATARHRGADLVSSLISRGAEFGQYLRPTGGRKWHLAAGG